MKTSGKLSGAPVSEAFIGGNGCWVECSKSELANDLIQKTVIDGKNACWMPFEDVTSDRCILQQDNTPTECEANDWTCQYAKCDGDDKCEQDVTKRMRDARNYTTGSSVEVPQAVMDAIRNEAEQRLKDLQVEYTALETSATELSKKTDQVLTAASNAVSTITTLRARVTELEEQLAALQSA
jgi:hypothetical protein